jgi:two-component system, OmpR family, copper resistance phosphate regulon response regulator CusR
MLPGCDGLDMLATLRKRGFNMPVLILSARDTVEDRVTGLNCGADDYLVKPFAFPELLARIRTLLRRDRVGQSTVLKLADLEMDLVKRTVIRSDQAVTLTVKEFQLLEYFLKNQNIIISRDMLARDVWHETNRATPLNNAIDVHIARLRGKIDVPFKTPLLHTVRGVGFVLKNEQLQ